LRGDGVKYWNNPIIIRGNEEVFGTAGVLPNIISLLGKWIPPEVFGTAGVLPNIISFRNCCFVPVCKGL